MKALGFLALVLLLPAALAPPLEAQTDYYNLDAGRPVWVEDAAPTERYAWEAQLAPVRLSRAPGGVYSWEVEPELAYGIAPGTQLEVGIPLRWTDLPGEEGWQLAGVEGSLLYNLNQETRTLPALAVGAGLLLPVGVPERSYASLKALMSRSLASLRLHANAEYTLGPEGGEGVEEVSRWRVGVALDRAFPLHSWLVVGDLYVEQPLEDEAPLAWVGEAGLRYQASPQWTLDAGLGRRFWEEEGAWSLTLGASHVFALRSLIPLRGR